MQMTLVFGFDQHYAMAAAVALRSLSRVLDPNDRVDAHLVVWEVDTPTRDRVESVTNASVALHWHDVDPAWLDDLPESSLPHVGYISKGSYLALFWDRYVPDAVERVLVIDPDVVLLESPATIWETDLGGCAAGAVRDVWFPAIGAPGAMPRWREQGLDGTSPYCNTGVLLLDRAAWRSLEVEQRCLELLATNEDVRLMDQDPLNEVLAGRWLELPVRWNYQVVMERWKAPWIFAFVDVEDLDEARRSPALLHFSGAAKPWNAAQQPPRAEEWWSVLAETPWAGLRRPDPPSAAAPSIVRRAARRVRRAASMLLRGHA